MTTAFDDVPPDELEHVVADIWRERGWDTTVSAVSRDGGVDVIAERANPFPEKQLLQVKHYGDDNPVSAPEIQQYAGLQHQHGDADSVVIVTSSRFTEPAQQTAREANVKLVDGDELAALAQETGILQAVEDEAVSTGPPPGDRTRPDAVPKLSDGGGPRPSDQIEELIRVVVMLFVLAVLVYSLWEYAPF